MTTNQSAPEFRVMRDCCRSGNCFYCCAKGVAPSPFGTPQRVEHLRTASAEFAEFVAEKWASYDARVEPVPA